jgi:natural product precursor
MNDMVQKISFNGLKKILSKKEMKNIIGGGYWCTCGGSGSWWEFGPPGSSCQSAYMNALEWCGSDGYGHNSLGAYCEC